MDQNEPNLQNQSPKSNPLFYCNTARIESSMYDVILYLGNKKSRNSLVPVPEDFDVSIIMSPQHAKAIYNALGENLKKYEEKFGEINIEPKKDE